MSLYRSPEKDRSATSNLMSYFRSQIAREHAATRRMGLMRRGLITLLTAFAVLCFAASAHATTWTVTDTSDNAADSGSLRYALAHATAGDTINFGTLFNNPQTITLNSALPAINITAGGTLSILGPGANNLTINGNGYTAFTITQGAIDISRLTITKAAPAMVDNYELRVSNCIFLDNSSSTTGGAILASGPAGYLTVYNSTFIGNTADSSGGAIEFAGGMDGTIGDNTFYQNMTTGVFGVGGAIHIATGAHAGIENNTFVENSSLFVGGAVESTTSSSSLTSDVSNNIFYENTTEGGTVYSTGYTSADHNLYFSNVASSSPNACYGCNPAETNAIVADPLLAPFGYYGGDSTQTFALLPGSAAICAGLASETAGMTSDQRGFLMDPNCTSAALIDVGSVQTNQFMVNVSTDDPTTATKNNCLPSSVGNSCTLRDAMLAAASTSRGDLTFASSLSGSTITLSTSPLATLQYGPDQVNIWGPGANHLTVSGNNDPSVGSIFHTYAGANTFIYGLTITGGTGTTGGQTGYGGGIFATNNVTLSNSAVINNTVNPNVASPYSYGGGIYLNNGTLTIIDSTISGNAASTPNTGRGGGIATNAAPGSKLTIINSTISGNTATWRAGAIEEDGNTVNIYSSTIANNQAPLDAGGIYVGGGTITLYNSILDGNSSTTTDTNNDYDEASGSLSNVDSVVGTGKSKLAALGNYGGTTQTMVPLPGSSAICEASTANIYPGTTTDQRGYPNENTTYTGYSIASPCVDAGSAQTNYSLHFVQQPTNTSVGSVITPAPTVAVLDNDYTKINGVTVPVTLAVGSGVLGGTLTQTTAGGVATFNDLTVDTAGSGDELGASLTISPTGASNVVTISVDSDPFDVAGTFSKFAVSAGSPQQAGQSFSFTVTAEDSGSNTVGGYTGTVHFTSSDSSATLPTNYTFVASDHGTHTFNATLVTLGAQTITATDTGDSYTGSSNTITVNAGPAAYLKVTGYPSPVYQYSSNNGTVTAYDQYNNVATSFAGPATISSSTDATATVTQPSSWSNGAATFSVAFDSTGAQSITASGTGLSSGSEIGIVVNAPPSYVVTTISDDASGVPANCPVNNSPASTTCTLRDALAATSANGSGSITFSPSVFNTAQTITLGTGGTLVIPQYTSITGATTGSGVTLKNLVTVDAATNYGVFSVNSGVLGINISSLNIVNGSTLDGGGIANGGTLSVNNSTISGSGALIGGGIYNSGTLTLINSTVSGNTALSGGGIANDGTMAVTNSALSGNSAINGGGIFNSVTLSVNDSTISGNSASTGAGGGIRSGGTLTIGNSIVSGNTAPSNPTFADIYNNATLNNLNGNVIGGSANLASLANYGGPTQSMVAQPGSPAICGGLLANIPTGITTDQRGYARTTTAYGSSCVDSGATQSAYSLSFTTSPGSQQLPSVAFTPSPVVQLYDHGTAVGNSGVSITVAASAGTLSGSTTQSTSSGAATFSGLSIATPQTNDYLTATATVFGTTTISATSSDFNVGKYSQTITFNPAVTSYTYSPNGTFSVSATASSNLTVSFASTTTGVCTVSGTTVTILSTGICTIQATQGGNASYNAATPVSVNFSIGKASQTITFNPATLTIPYSPSGFNVSATASSGLTVSFASTTTGVCTVSGTHVNIVTLGQCTIVASQAGNSNYSAATNVSKTFTLVKGSQTITFNPAVTTYSYSPHGTFTVSATASSGFTVSFASSTSSVCTVVVNTVNILTPGTCSIVASQAGNSYYNAATPVTVNFTIIKAAQTITFTPPFVTPVYTPGGVFNLYATSTSGLTVSFTSTTTSVCTITTSGTPAVPAAKILTAGVCIIEATQAGNADYTAATPVFHSFTILQAVTNTTLKASSLSVKHGQSVTLTATVSSNTAGTLSGTVSFFDGGTLLNTVTVSSGSAALSTSSLATGTHSITAVYSGNTNFHTSTSAAVNVTVTP